VDKKVQAIAPRIRVLRGAKERVHEGNHGCAAPEGELHNADSGQLFHRSKQKRRPRGRPIAQSRQEEIEAYEGA
jgi:hypothetical protein